MKLAIIGTRGIPNNYGGFEQFAEYLSDGLSQQGHQVYVYNSHNHPFQDQNYKGVNIIHCFDPEYKIGTAGQFIYDLFSEYSNHFTYNNNGKYNMDLRNIANEILSRQGISDVTISSECTFDNQSFFSYRRDNTSGRFISLIWFNNS